MAVQDTPPTADLLTAAAQELRLSATLEINELVKKHHDKGRRVVHLGFGEATFPVPDAALKKHVEASRNTSYLPVAGLDKLREVCYLPPPTPCPIERCADNVIDSLLPSSSLVGSVWRLQLSRL
jgi:hypothetical protein